VAILLGTACLGESALEGEAVRRALGTLGLDQALLVAFPGAVAADLRDLPVAGVRTDAERLGTAIDVARVVNAPRIVLDLPEDAELESTCRQLFALTRNHPGLGLALLTPAAGTLAAPAALELVLDDLAGQGVGYWHRPSRVHGRPDGDVAWLDTLGRRLVGMSLDDVAHGEAGLPPGTGEVDLTRAAELSGRGTEIALDVDPVPGVALMRVALEHLRAVGFP